VQKENEIASGSKPGIDATKKIPGLPREIERSAEPSKNHDEIISRGEVSNAPGRRSSRWMPP
jgi:3-polyprenyl-4-hydroxybenzoate decarboxylase